MKTGIGSHTRAFRGKTDSWITPEFLIDDLGPFDLDPCASKPQPWSCATKSYTKDGLDKRWCGRVWLNPPYGPETGRWLEKLAGHGYGTALIFARTETEMFWEQVWKRAKAILFIRKRLVFYKPDGMKAKGNAGGPSALVAYSGEDARRLCESQIEGALVEKWRR